MVFDQDMGKNRKDIAALSPMPLNYNNISKTAWLTSEEPIMKDTHKDTLSEVLSTHNIKVNDVILADIKNWAIKSQESLTIDLLGQVVNRMLDIYKKSRNPKLTTYALQRVFGFENAALQTYEEKAKELGITEQAVSKLVNKISDLFNIRSRTMHQRRDPQITKNKKKICKKG